MLNVTKKVNFKYKEYYTFLVKLTSKLKQCLEWKSQFESTAEYKEQKIQKEKYAVVVIGLELKSS